MFLSEDLDWTLQSGDADNLIWQNINFLLNVYELNI